MSLDEREQSYDSFMAINVNRDTIPDTISNRDNRGNLGDGAADNISAEKPACKLNGSILTSTESASTYNIFIKNNDDIATEATNEDDNNNAAQRATVIRRQIDPKRLKNSGLGLRIAKVLHQKALEKQQQQQDNPKEVIKKQQEQKQQTDNAATTINVSPITAAAANISSVGESVSIDQKSAPLQNPKKVLSVPKITITSPPCDNGIEILRENKCDRLEDVKRILNRQILMRKLSNNPPNTIIASQPAPISNHREQPITATTTSTLQLPPQTSIKPIVKIEMPVSTMISATKTAADANATTTNNSPFITVRKFHTIASNELVIKSTGVIASPSQTSQQKSQIFLSTTHGGTTIRPITIGQSSAAPSSTQNTQPLHTIIRPMSLTGLTGIKTVVGIQQNTGVGANIFPISISRTLSTQIQAQMNNAKPQQQRLMAVVPTKAIIRPVMTAEVRMKPQQYVTVRPITSLSSSAVPSTESAQVPHIESLKTAQDSPESPEKQLDTKPTKPTNPWPRDMSSNRNLSTEKTANRYRIFPTIPTPKPKVFEIPGHKQLEQKALEEAKDKAKKPNIMKASLEYKTVPLVKPKRSRLSLDATETVQSIKNSKVPCCNMEVAQEHLIESGRDRHAFLKTSTVKDVKDVVEELQENTDHITLAKTENVPIVLENKLLQPAEHIDLKGLRLPRANLDDSLSKSKDATSQKPFIEGEQSSKPIKRTQKAIENRKMHIVSNEKLKSARADMAALAKAILQRTTKTTDTSKTASSALPTKKDIESNTTKVSVVQDTLQQLISPAKPVEVITPRQRPIIPKASMSMTKKDFHQQTRQKALLREKVLAFCSLKDDVSHATPAKEYPKTVEIVEDEETTDDDVSGPTAVDFIASLSMLNCSNPSEHELDKQVENANVVHAAVEISLNKLDCDEKAEETLLNTRKSESEEAAKADKLNPNVAKHELTQQMTVNNKEMLEKTDEQRLDAVIQQTNLTVKAIKTAETSGNEGEALKEAVTSDSKADKTICTLENVATVEHVEVEKENNASSQSAQLKDLREITSTDSNEKIKVETVEPLLPLEDTTTKDLGMNKDEALSKNVSTNAMKTMEVVDPNESNEPEKIFSVEMSMDKDNTCSPSKSTANMPTQLPSPTANTTGKTTRKRIGIRNAPINLIARKKPTLRKPIRNESVTPVENAVNCSTDKPEVFENLPNSSIETGEVTEDDTGSILKLSTEVVVDNEENDNIETKPEAIEAMQVILEPSKLVTNKTKDKETNFCPILETTELQAIPPAIEETAKDKANAVAAEIGIAAKNLLENSEPSKEKEEVLNTMTSSTDNRADKEQTNPKDLKTDSNVEDTQCLQPAAPLTVDDSTTAPSYVMSINLAADKDKSKQEEQKEPEEHGIKILATVPIATDERDNAVCSNAEKATHSTVQSEKIALPEVGTIIDMKAYGLEKSDTDIIVQEIMLEERIDREKSNQNSTENTGKSEKPETDSETITSAQNATTVQSKSMEVEHSDSDSQSFHADINDYSDNDSQMIQMTSRKRLCRKRPISALLSTSGSEAESAEEAKRPISRASRTSVVKNFNECSSTSANSELYGFPTNSTDIEKPQKLHDETENTILTMEPNSDACLSPQVTAKKSKSIYSSPFVTVDSRRNIPLKKRWELTQHRSHDETDITDDTSPAADDDTMDDEEINTKIVSKEVEISSKCLSGPDTSDIQPTKRCSLSSDAENTPTSQEQNKATSESAAKLTPLPCGENPISPPIKAEKVAKESEVMGCRKRMRKVKPTIAKSSTDETEEDQHKLQHRDTQDTPKSPPKKRGRPPKKHQKLDSPSANSLDIEIVTKIEKTEGTPASRCRKPRLDTSAKATTSKAVRSKSLEKAFQAETEQSKLEDTLNVVDDSIASNIEETISPVKKKRGRKTREIIEGTPRSTLVSTPQEILEQKTQPLVSINDEIMQPAETIHDKTNELKTPAKKKRGRKPRDKSEGNVTAIDISCDDHLERILKSQETTTPIVKIDAESVTPLPKKRGRRSKASIANDETPVSETSFLETQEPTNELPTPKARGRKRRSDVSDDFNARLLLIRRREQLDTEEMLTVGHNEAGEGPLQCGLCLAYTTTAKWYKHLGEHYGVGWVVGKQPAVNVALRSKVLSSMTAYFKQKETTLPCRICARSYRSPLGLLLHIESCGDTVRVDCPTCGNQYTKLSFTVHQRSCQKTTNDKDEHEASSNESELVLNNTGRYKRASQIKAETKLKKLTKELSENESHFEPKDFIKQRKNTAEEQNGKLVYYCTACIPPGPDFQTEEAALNHVVQKHNLSEEQCQKFEADGSDFDEIAEQIQESEDSTTDTGTDLSDDASERAENTTKSTSAKKKSNSRKRKKIHEAKLLGGLPTVYTPRSHEVSKLVLRKWKQFIGSNYAAEQLYPYAIPIYTAETKRALDLLAAQTKSMKFAFSQKHKSFEAVGAAGSLEWQQLSRFQTMDHRSNDKLICLGAPIKTLAWVPVPENVSEQYLVVSCRKNLSSFTRFIKPKSEEALLYIYKITDKDKQDNLNAMKKTVHAEIHYVLYIPNGPVHTLAFLPSGGYDLAANRLGLLAVGTASSEISIYALPIQPGQYEALKIEATDENARVVSLKPAIELTLDATADSKLSGHSLVSTQCIHICWSEFSGHQHIFVSYANGFIAIWEIVEPENSIYNLNCHMRNGRRCFTPLHYFYFGEKVIKAFAVHYDTNGPRWLAFQGYARKLVVYDIRNFSHPIPLKEELLKNVPRDIDWCPLWEAFTIAFCDAIPNHGRCVLAFNPASVAFTHSRMDNMLSGVSTVHYNPWHSICGIGVDNGDLIFVNAREMNQDQQVLLRSKRNVMAISVLDIKRLDGEELIRTKSKDEPKTWQLHKKDYKEKYGLVFGQVNKFTSDERSAYLSDQRIPPPYVERYMRISILRWNLNALGKRYVAIGYENGFLRLMRFKPENYFD